MVVSGSRWGDDDDDFLPQRTESEPDANGVRTIVEWKYNEAGQKVKVTKTVRKVTEVTRVSKRALERKKWAKFGAAKNTADNSNVTYTANEDVRLEDPNADQVLPGEKKEDENIFAGVKNSSIVVCRHCGMVGDHWTLKCPYKDTPIDELPTDLATRGTAEASAGGESGASAGAGGESGGSALSGAFGSGRYVPPSMRGREGMSAGGGGGGGMEEDRDFATLRVTNVSPDTREDDLKELFRAFGPVARVYLAKDRETFESRGFAFVSFMHREDAERALNKLQGYGYDHLILKLEWAKPSNKPKETDAGSMGTTFRSGYGKALPQNIAPPARK
ncbi:hypothetical protein PybrP1_004702 [[Pythium] brassicae (nom. inval.)]|nr:hypothetical protein PybrP1_004702 [[Pythium] brassicae (nom. inval.)]